MDLFKFTKLTEGYPIDVYNNGDMARDFTYIDDLIEALIRLVKCEPTSTKDNHRIRTIVCPMLLLRS